MIVDLILERRAGAPYTKQTIAQIYEYCDVFGFSAISAALDAKNEKAMKEALCAYIEGEYNPDIKAYVRSVDWTSAKKLTIPERMEALRTEYAALREAPGNRYGESFERTLERMCKINDEYSVLARRNVRD